MLPMRRCLTKPTLLDGLLKRRLAFHGHLVRKDGITLDLMIGRLHGTRPRGRPRTTWLKDLATQANISYKEAITIPRDRKKWKSVGSKSLNDGAIEECCASHGRNMLPMRRCLTKPTLLDGLLKRRLAFHGHLVRKDGITLDLMIGRLHGTRPRGRPRTTWLKDLATQANISYKEAITIPRDRKKWRSVGNPRRMPDE